MVKDKHWITFSVWQHKIKSLSRISTDVRNDKAGDHQVTNGKGGPHRSEGKLTHEHIRICFHSFLLNLDRCKSSWCRPSSFQENSLQILSPEWQSQKMMQLLCCCYAFELGKISLIKVGKYLRARLRVSRRRIHPLIHDGQMKSTSWIF